MSSEKRPVLRNPDGTLAKGTRAMNPGGRPKGIERRMRELVEQQMVTWDGRTLDGWEALTQMMFDVALGKKVVGESELTISMKDRIAAVQFLFDRVFGKAKIQIESDNTHHAGHGLANVDVDALSKEDLEALEMHVELIRAKTSGKATDKVIELAPSDVDELDT